MKCVLRKVTVHDQNDLPYLLFAYREVPQQATGYAQSKLLYGRHLKQLHCSKQVAKNQQKAWYRQECLES